MINYRQIAINLISIKYQIVDNTDQINKLASFLGACNHSILKDSIQEAMAPLIKQHTKTHGKNQAVDQSIEIPNNFVDKVSRSYHRKISELAQYYTPLHIFETAFRSFTYYFLNHLYGTDEWWHDFKTADNRPIDKSTAVKIREINNVPITADQQNAVHSFVVKSCRDGNPLLSTDTALLIEETTFGTLQDLLYYHWTAVSGYLKAAPAEIPEKEILKTKFTNVRNLRNDIFHHKNSRNKKTGIFEAEALLNLLGINLKTSVNASQYNIIYDLEYRQIYDEKYHINLMKSYNKFELNCQFDEELEKITINALDPKESLVKILGKTKSSKLKKLQGITISQIE